MLTVAVEQDLDPTYNVVQFKLYETKPLNPHGELVKFELDLIAKKLPPELSPRICVLMSLRFYLSGFISKDPFILDGPMSGEMPRDAVNRIYVKVYKMDMHLSSLLRIGLGKKSQILPMMIYTCPS
nr:hypothetical protein [Tanacetum cinerariifolium]